MVNSSKICIVLTPIDLKVHSNQKLQELLHPMDNSSIPSGFIAQEILVEL